VFSTYDAGMRSAVFDAATQIDPDEQLSTGEAAKLLNSSRQHVVDLCDRGLLPYTTTGTHRRVRRGDVETLRQRTDRLTQDQQRSLWLAYAVAGVIVSDPEGATALARANIAKMRPQARGSATRWFDEWDTLLDGPIDVLLAVYTSRDLRGRELRQSSPFAGLLSDDARTRVLSAWRAERNRRAHHQVRR
jgi:excisionase family DNA binding protein